MVVMTSGQGSNLPKIGIIADPMRAQFSDPYIFPTVNFRHKVNEVYRELHLLHLFARSACYFLLTLCCALRVGAIVVKRHLVRVEIRTKYATV